MADDVSDPRRRSDRNTQVYSTGHGGRMPLARSSAPMSHVGSIAAATNGQTSTGHWPEESCWAATHSGAGVFH